MQRLIRTKKITIKDEDNGEVVKTYTVSYTQDKTCVTMLSVDDTSNSVYNASTGWLSGTADWPSSTLKEVLIQYQLEVIDATYLI